MWMLLLIRMVTRVANPLQDAMDDDELADGGEGEDGELDFYDRQDKLRRTLLNYVMTDFSSR
jgi:symplekin